MEKLINRRGLFKAGGAAGAVWLAGRLGLPKSVEASATPENLPPHIIYFEEAAVSYLNKSDVSVTLRRKGDILLLMSQKIRTMGVVWDINSTDNPSQTQVLAIGNAGDTPVTIDYQTFDGIFARQDRERTSRLDRDSLIEDVTAAGLVQVSRTRIPGNCVPTGCASTRLVTVLAFEQNGKPQFDRLDDRVDSR